ncbi:hypothetical protein [Paenibacillus harenae]|uniref:hypothetical protein n=1 Tax=Paenibacillus harenae TaxID=306543 RepID=UPI0004025A69|nr:hypothetical protein [Paenibacillus harenae]
MELKGMRRMADKNEMQEMKDTLRKLQSQVDRLTANSHRRRPGWANFAIGFIIVFVVLIIGIGILQFIRGQ